VKSEYKQVQIPIDKIQFIEGLKDYVKIYVEGEKSAILTLTSMKTIERYLPATEFLRVHRSFIVNTSKISIIERNRIVFGNHYIPVSESYKQAFNDYVAGYSLSLQRDNQSGED
ncbi:LytTR family DNA-binding domain-containing protein, partial [uncultured Muribaculum sp.]